MFSTNYFSTKNKKYTFSVYKIGVRSANKSVYDRFTRTFGAQLFCAQARRLYIYTHFPQRHDADTHIRRFFFTFFLEFEKKKSV